MTKSSNSYRFYVLILLMLTYLMSFMDRQIMSVLIEDIGKDFTLNDMQRGLLMGLAFSLFYAGLGIPVAWLADRTSRKNIISISVTIWSAATVLCGMAGGFWSLFAARVGVGIGEAGGTPPAHSMLGDYFKKSELTRALSIYSIGPPLGATLGLIAGGWLAETYGWRAAFVIVGMPGVILGIIVYFTVREPERGKFAVEKPDALPKEGLGGSLMALIKEPAYMGALGGHTLQAMAGFILMSWAAVIMIRTFNAPLSEVGLLLGMAILIGSPPGMLIGGILSDKLALRDARWMAWIPGLAMVLTLPAYMGAMFAPDIISMVVLISIGTFFIGISYPPNIGIIQTIVKPSQRALASAFLLLASNIVGMGMGPLLSGWLSDILKPVYATSSINMAVAICQISLIPAALFFFWTSFHLKDHSIRDET